VSSTNTDVQISVRDTGIGIDAKQLERLFMPFERLDSVLRINTPGTGLGLYLTQKIAKDLLGGNVSVQSEPGVGSCFTLKICKHLTTKA
jgi:signal transduction histidine kinase